MGIDVSIIIPNFNGEKYIANCIDSLLQQCYNDTMEIIVVDDCSSDQSREIIKKYHQVKLIENQQNYGFAKSVNRGICASKGKFCLLLNNDVVVEPEFVHALYKHILKRRDAFSVSSKMIRYYERDKLDDTGDFYNIFGWAYKRGDGKAVESYEESTQVFSSCAGAAIYRRSVLNEIGLFDESFFAYLEDVDLSYRGLINGYSNYYAPEAVCYHIGSATTADGQKYSPFKVKISARNNVYLAYKNMPLLQLILNSPFLFIGFLIKWARFSAGGYGKSYIEGVKEGFKSLDNVNKVKFKVGNLFNYLRIQGLMMMNLPRQVLVKFGK
ncbi:glycosyltransferase family 2 protein [Eubacteriaceae bacterium ES3]|nr:glycosyltransferase family 2 protein [Eubacteriaceae bacterium ES3]